MILSWNYKCYYLIIKVWSNLRCFDSPRFLEWLTIWDGGSKKLYIEWLNLYKHFFPHVQQILTSIDVLGHPNIMVAGSAHVKFTLFSVCRRHFPWTINVVLAYLMMDHRWDDTTWLVHRESIRLQMWLFTCWLGCIFMRYATHFMEYI